MGPKLLHPLQFFEASCRDTVLSNESSKPITMCCRPSPPHFTSRGIPVKRRDFLTSNAVLAGATISAASQLTQRTAVAQVAAAKSAGGKVRQSVMGWCFNPMDTITLAKHCKEIGLEAMEGIPSNQYRAVTDLGLKISLVSSHGFAKGPLDPENHAEVEMKLRAGIDLAVQYGAPNVITFTGMQKAGISDTAARKNCIECWRRSIRNGS